MSVTSMGGLTAPTAWPARRAFTALTVLAMVLSSAIVAAPASAATIDSLTYSPSGAVVGTAVPANADVAVFTPKLRLWSGERIRLTLPAGSEIASIVKEDFTIAQVAAAGSGDTDGVATVPAAVAFDNELKTITLTMANGTLSTGTTSPGKGEITIRTSNSLVGEITHPTQAITNATFRVDTLYASGDASLDTGTISDVTFVHGAAAKLAFSVQPSSSAAGVELTPEVTVQDAFGNTVTGSTAAITLAIGSNPGSATLNGTASLSATAGVAAWTGAQALNFVAVASGYTLTASADGLTVVTSDPFDVTGVAAKLAFSVQPSSSAAGAVLTPTVAVQDEFGNTVTGSTAEITLSIGTDPGSATLNGTKVLTASGGVATWTSTESLDITKAGSGYTLTASASDLTAATSDAFDITNGVAAKLAFAVQPVSSVAGAVLTPTVTVQDEFGNTVTGSTAEITLSIASNPGAATLNGTTVLVAAGGVAAWIGPRALDITKAGSGYTLTASASDLTAATSDAFNVAAGVTSAANSTVTASPESLVADGTATSTVTVTLQDASGNPVVGSNVSLVQTGSSTISDASGVSSAEGVVIFDVKSTIAEVVTYTATDTTSSVTVDEKVTVTFTARPSSSSPTPPPTDGSTVTVPPGGAASSDPDGSGPTSDDPLVMDITVPSGGSVTFAKEVASGSIRGFELLGVQFKVTAPDQSADEPLRIKLNVATSRLANGIPAVFRDGAHVGPCRGAPGVASPDPCVADFSVADGVLQVDVLSSKASTWAVGELTPGSIEFVCPAGTTVDAGFGDVERGGTHADAVDCLAASDIAKGKADGSYAPDESVTRAQMASFIQRLLVAAGVDLPDPTSTFTDIDGNGHAQAIESLAAAKIVKGKTETTYDPSGLVSRQQMASFLVRTYEYATDAEAVDADGAFTDIGGVHAENIRKLVGLGVTLGVTDTEYAPAVVVERGQMASFLGRTLNRLAVEGHSSD